MADNRMYLRNMVNPDQEKSQASKKPIAPDTVPTASTMNGAISTL